MKVYGPYRRKKDGRQHVIKKEGTHRTTQSYPRYLTEEFLGRMLEKWEHVDHINNDPTDDRLDNFQILTPKQNNEKSVLFHGRSAKYLDFICPTCHKKFKLYANRYKYNQIQRGSKGPFCSRHCAGVMYH